MRGPRSVILYPVLPNRVPWACCQVLNFYKKFSVLQYPMSKVNGQSVAVTEKSLWAGPTLFIFSFHVKHAPVACGLWPRLADCGACLWAGPTLIFYFCLRAGGILPALCPCSGFFLVFTITNIFNFWIPAFSTIQTFAALLWRRAAGFFCNYR